MFVYGFLLAGIIFCLGGLTGDRVAARYTRKRTVALMAKTDAIARLQKQKEVLHSINLLRIRNEHAKEIEAIGSEIAGLQAQLDFCREDAAQLVEQRNEIHERYAKLLTRAISIRKTLGDLNGEMPTRRDLKHSYRTMLDRVGAVYESLEDVS
ncbi:hypothetical protein [Allorhodopirellula heiligendammensis]|uniref:Uncharacterized protein n=1 Tax=Allorhodopirellula heiligendammensis TaxID=2714739 RepID=A0A5C6C3X8_9BACT|nr:hypothetical protein [Allorhodopirellula heiligendammensis]TWU18004.1 hypothetical protein Poly21_01570 [Allorhodopirellula heiligendammensis]